MTYFRSQLYGKKPMWLNILQEVFDGTLEIAVEHLTGYCIKQ